MGPTVTAAPYSGEEVTETVRVLTDGTRITNKNAMRKIWRDTQGRTRVERPLGMGPNRSPTPQIPVIIEITDPVAGFKYTLDTQRKVAHRQKLPPMPSPGAPAPMGPATVFQSSASLPTPRDMTGGITSTTAQTDPAPRPRFKAERIGTQTIDGVLAEGTRNTVTYPVGMVGNDREFSNVSENWTSTELKILIFSKTVDPLVGESTFRIANLSRMPPDPLLFMPPADFTIVDETGGFTIQWGNGAQ